MFSFPVADSHVHTKFSFDGRSEMREQLEKARQLGLSVIAFTEHMEINSPPEEENEKSIAAGLDMLEKLRKEYPEIKILRGVELGQATQNIKRAEKLLNTFDFDFVLGSLHNIRNEEDFYYLHYTDGNAAELYDRYLSELKELVEWGRFDSLAHLTYPLRYMTGREGVQMPFERYRDRYDEILTLLAEKEKALEINTAKVRVGWGLCPGEDVIRLWKECGGKYVTLGSDAHEAEYLSVDMETGRQALLNAGFDSYVYFEKHEPKKIIL